MNFFEKAKWFLSPYYVDEFEQELDEFLQSLTQTVSPAFVREKILRFMAQDLVKTAIYLEWKFKGYKQLKKSARRKLYKNADLVRLDFENFCQKKSVNISNKSEIVAALQEYLSPDKNFCYLESSAFFGLLKDPTKEKLVGDCNQICTLYVALSAKYFSVFEWKIHLYDGHVALVFENFEVEATNGTKGKIKDGGQILPIESLISVNILDVSEENRRKFNIVPERFLQASTLVKILSPNDVIAKNNLRVALQNLGIELLKKNNFELAEKYFLRLDDSHLLDRLWQQAVQKFVDDKNFSTAEKWAKKSNEKSLLLFVHHARAAQKLTQKKYSEARKYFGLAKEPENVKIVDESEMFDWYEDVKNLTKIKDLKAKKSVIKKIHTRAREVSHAGMEDWCESVLKEI